jgi:hypothetical protein
MHVPLYSPYLTDCPVPGKFINAAGGGSHNGTNIHQWDNPGAKETRWRLRVPETSIRKQHPLLIPFVDYLEITCGVREGRRRLVRLALLVL